MMRVPAQIVPLEPRVIMRTPGMPCAQTSTWKPFGSLILSTGMSESGVTVILPACPDRFGFFIRSGKYPPFDLRSSTSVALGGLVWGPTICCARAYAPVNASALNATVLTTGVREKRERADIIVVLLR